MTREKYYAIKEVIQDEIVSSVIENKSIFNISIYPNPTTGQIQIVNDDEIPLEELKLFTSFGVNILGYSASNVPENINLSGIEDGVYYLYIKSDIDFIVLQIVKLS